MNDAETVMAHCDELATFTEEPGRITRPYASEALRRAQETVIAWMREAGMAVTRDNVGNLRARYEGTGLATEISTHRVFNLDDLRAHIGQQHAAEWAGHKVG